jgi:hypothetical protein
MGLHVKERWKLRQIEQYLRKKDPDLDAFLAGRSAFRRIRAVLWAIYLVPPVLIALGTDPACHRAGRGRGGGCAVGPGNRMVTDTPPFPLWSAQPSPTTMTAPDG